MGFYTSVSMTLAFYDVLPGRGHGPLSGGVSGLGEN
jgi:hypothetical protein